MRERRDFIFKKVSGKKNIFGKISACRTWTED